MFLCLVTAGKSVVYGTNDPSRDSFLGGAHPTIANKYIELIVCDGDAMLPCYVLCYTY